MPNTVPEAQVPQGLAISQSPSQVASATATSGVAFTLGDVDIPTLCLMSVSETSGYEYAHHKPLSGQPILQATGPKPKQLALSIHCHSTFINPASLISELQGLLNSGAAFDLYKEEGRRLGRFVLSDFELGEQAFSSGGDLLFASLNATLIQTGEM